MLACLILVNTAVMRKAKKAEELLVLRISREDDDEVFYLDTVKCVH